MKRVWLWIALLLSVVCGCGGSGSTTSVNNGTGTPPGSGGIVEVGPGTPTGNVVVNITSIDGKTADDKTAEAQPAATMVRLVISNSALTIGGAAYKVIVDGSIVSSITGLAFPVANGYTFEVVTYTQQTVQPGGTPTVNRMLKYAKAANVNITPSGATVNLSTTPIVANFTLPNPTYSGQILNITANMPQPTPLYSIWNLFLSTSPINNALHTVATPIHSGIRTPIVLTPGTLYAQGEFFINANLIDTTPTGSVIRYDTAGNLIPPPHATENYHDWTFNYPNPEPAFGDSPLSVPLDLVSLNIPIN